MLNHPQEQAALYNHGAGMGPRGTVSPHPCSQCRLPRALGPLEALLVAWPWRRGRGRRDRSPGEKASTPPDPSSTVGQDQDAQDQVTSQALQAGDPHSDSNFQVYDLMKGTIRSETIRISASLSW